MPSDAYKLNEICDIAGVTPRTVYFYIQKGLIDPPGTRGSGANYGRRHLERLQMIRKLQQDEHLPLAVIRERLAALSDAEVARRIAGASGASAAQEEALETGPTRSQWDRIVLTRDVELHVRRPLSRERNKQVTRLLEEARRIMKPTRRQSAQGRPPATPCT